jgi:UDP:flavonoid glycosyltransferase YjiC (YdhE family)
MLPLGHALQQRGHRITIFSGPKAQIKVQAAGFSFCNVESARSSRFTPKRLEKIARFTNLIGIQHTFQNFARLAETRLQNAAMIQEQGVEALLVDLSVFEGGTIAEFLNIPYVTICCILPFYQDSTVPPIATCWGYNPVGWAKLRNSVANRFFTVLAQPVLRIISHYRRMWHLPAYLHPNNFFSKLAIITRHIPEFEFPRQLPPHFHFTGPFHEAITRPSIPFPFEQLIGKPLIYASMGTMQNRFAFVFETIAAACAPLEAQLVISLGGGLDPEAVPNLPGNPIVVKYAPQLELLRRASLTVTHAGLNTTLESLSYGVPLVAIPVTDDQPGVAARIVWTGTGELVTLARLDAFTLRRAIERVLTEPSYQQNAMRLKEAIHQTRGVNRAVEIIEQAISTKQPVID